MAAPTATRTYKPAGGLQITEHGFDVTITGEPPRYRGWRFVAAVDAVDGGTVLRYPPGSTATVANDQVRAGECDHCQTTRARRSTVLVAHDDTGQLLQVGRSCLKDFLGHRILPVFLTTDQVADTIGRHVTGSPVAWDVQLSRWMEGHVPRLREPLRTYARASRRQSSTPDIPRPARYTPQAGTDACLFGVGRDTS